jgi:hypothetical protein
MPLLCASLAPGILVLQVAARADRRLRFAEPTLLAKLAARMQQKGLPASGLGRKHVAATEYEDASALGQCWSSDSRAVN